jgi:two-component system CheB/CheR fusion protein
VPSASTADFPIVAIGASAGGVEAITALLHGVPATTGMSFVVLLHTSGAHPENLEAVIGRATPMPVVNVREAARIEPDHVYLVPGRTTAKMDDGVLLVRGGELPVGGRIDGFMRSLADHHGEKSIGIILSGSATDGTLGLAEIKAAGGMTFAQDDSAQQHGMPRSAVAAGHVDAVMSPGQIADELAHLSRHAFIDAAAAAPLEAAAAEGFTRIVQILHDSLGLDFRHYKRNTLQRRMSRRMLLNRLDTLEQYADFLLAQPDEQHALYQDILIGVTSFFRDADAYAALRKEVFPALTDIRSRGEAVRIWSPGCSTGEEPYSIAMALAEYLEQSGRQANVQIFATDVNGASIEKARAGIYSPAIASDLTPERLQRWFEPVDGAFRVNKHIRDWCIFARQDVLRDPPFSRIDFLACRNLLIYLESSLQQRLVPVLHYALREKGVLWLGKSETIGAYADLFDLVDQREKIYVKKPALSRPAAAELRPFTGRAVAAVLPPAARLAPEPQREADRLLLARYAPPSVLLDNELNIIQFRGETGPYLAPAPGKASFSLLKMLREGLSVAVRDVVERARHDKSVARQEGVRVRSEAGWRDVNLVAVPLEHGDAAGALLLLFEEPGLNLLSAKARDDLAKSEMRDELSRSPDAPEREIARLRQELATTRQYLQAVIEQQEAANVELQSANEEIQSSNEELQSINEELETSKEEVQSANEELASVNSELHNRNAELTHSINDFTNLLASVQLPILMLGPDLQVRRFTMAAEKTLGVSAADIGRPLRDIKLVVGGELVAEMARDVVETITARETEVRDAAGRWHMLRVRPYRTVDNRIEGAVVVLVEVDRIKRAEQSLRESEARFELLANSAPVMIWMSDASGLRFANRAFEEFVGAMEPAIRGVGWGELMHPDDRAGFTASYDDAVAARAPFVARARLKRADGEYRWMKCMANPRFDGSGAFQGFVGCAVDLTDVKEAETALEALERSKDEFLAMLAHELRNPLSGVRNASLLLRRTRGDPIVDEARKIIDRQTETMVRMVDDLLDVTRITHGKIRIEADPVDLVEVMRRAISDCEPECDAAKLHLEVQLPARPLVVQGDAVRLAQVFSNLLGNAAKFTPAGGHIWVSLERESRGAHTLAVARVRDDGSGISTAMLSRVFDLFVQEDRKAGGGGVGLGLTLARRLVELQGGTIEARSPGRGKGSEFIVRLPIGQARTDAAAPATHAHANPRRLLIVDDNRDSAWSLRMMLSLDGHDVAIVSTGGEAVEAAARMQAEVVLLDIGLPDMDGYAVAQALRGDPRTRDALIIAATGYGRSQDRERSRRAGIDAHLTKPIDLDELGAILERRPGAAPREP